LKYLLFRLPLMYFSSDINLSEKQLDVAFAWLLANQHKITIILDGLDQARFTLPDFIAQKQVNVHKKYFASELLCFLLVRKFLPKVRLILTSRPHSILHFGVYDSDYVLFLDDLSKEDMKTLIRFYIKSEDVDSILSKLLKTSPKIKQLTFCPLFLRLFCHLYDIVGDEIWKIVQSTASLFYELLNRLQSCAHKGSQLDEDEVMAKLSKLAYDKTMQGSVVITQEDLLKCQITPNEVQDLMIGVHSNSNSALVGPSLFYFSHQSIQEYLTSRYAWLHLSVEKYDEFLNLIFPEITEKKELIMLAKPQDEFNVVRTFFFSNINVLQLNTELLEVKKSKFILKSTEHMISFHRRISYGDYANVIRSDFNEITNLGMINQLKQKFENLKFCILTKHSHIDIDESFMNKFVIKIKELCLKTNNFDINSTQTSQINSNDIDRISNALCCSNIKIELLKIHNVDKYDENLFTSFFEITNKMDIEQLAIVLSNHLKEDLSYICSKIKEKIESFQTTSIVSNEILVELEAYLRNEQIEAGRIIFEGKLTKGQTTLLNIRQMSVVVFDSLNSFELVKLTALLVTFNVKVEELKMELVTQYDIQLFTILFDVINIINVKKIGISLFVPIADGWSLNYEKKNLCKIFHEQIRCLETQNTVSNNITVAVEFNYKPLLEAKLTKGQSPLFTYKEYENLDTDSDSDSGSEYSFDEYDYLYH